METGKDTKMYEIKEKLKLIGGMMKDRTLEKLLINDKLYQHISQEEKKAYEAYESIEFSKEQRQVVEILLAKNSEVQFERCDNAYLAGLMDAYDVFRQFNLVRE